MIYKTRNHAPLPVVIPNEVRNLGKISYPRTHRFNDETAHA